jgi:hypothetical protein
MCGNVENRRKRRREAGLVENPDFRGRLRRIETLPRSGV